MTPNKFTRRYQNKDAVSKNTFCYGTVQIIPVFFWLLLLVGMAALVAGCFNKKTMNRFMEERFLNNLLTRHDNTIKYWKEHRQVWIIFWCIKPECSQ